MGVKRRNKGNMGKNPNSQANLKPFVPGFDPRRNLVGAPKSTLDELEQILGVKFTVALSKQDKFKIIESLMESSLAELKKIAENVNAPVFLVNIAMAMVLDTKKGSTYTIESLMDRFFGKARQESVIIGDKESPVFINQESTVIVMPSNGRD